MIVTFLDKNFKGLQNNASLVVDNGSYSLIKRPCEMNELTCTCEAFTEDIQPTFLVVKDNKGRYIYGCLAGIPTLNNDNKTEINGTDLKSMLSSDVIVNNSDLSNITTVNDYIDYIFGLWNTEVNQGSFTCELNYNTNVGTVNLSNLQPVFDKKTIVNAWEEIQAYLKYYDLFLDSEVDLINKKVIFTVGKTRYRNINIKLWEYGIKNYGKWVASVNECQGYYVDESNDTWTAGYKWILTSNNEITTTVSNRDIYPIKRKVITNNESLNEANIDALTELLDNLFNENIEIPTTDINPSFETNFAIYVKKGQPKYKDLPCGELRYNEQGIYQVQIGYRYNVVNFV